MYLMYVDESGDPGPYNGLNSKFYILSGLIIEDRNWMQLFERSKTFRNYLKNEYGFPLRTEIHSSELARVKKNEIYKQFRKSVRMKIFKDSCSAISQIFSACKIINVCFDKRNFIDVKSFQDLAWNRLVRRFDYHLKEDLYDLGMIVPDIGDNKAITSQLRRLRSGDFLYPKYSESLSTMVENIIEDPVFRDSNNSIFIQFADCIVTALRYKEFPKSSLNKYQVHHQYKKLTHLYFVPARSNEELGIVRQ